MTLFRIILAASVPTREKSQILQSYFKRDLLDMIQVSQHTQKWVQPQDPVDNGSPDGSRCSLSVSCPNPKSDSSETLQNVQLISY